MSASSKNLQTSFLEKGFFQLIVSTFCFQKGGETDEPVRTYVCTPILGHLYVVENSAVLLAKSLMKIKSSFC
jgi:hypothetical protein